MLSDLRESGSIEQDADLVMFLYREEYYDRGEDADVSNKGIAEVIIAKHRNGPTGDFKVAWMSKYAKFASMAHTP
jgi:replicative DNA helicase